MRQRRWQVLGRFLPVALVAVALLISSVAAHGQTRSREDNAPSLTHRLGNHWSFGGSIEIDAISETNFDLASSIPDDTATFEPRVDVGLAYVPIKHLRFYTQIELSHGVSLQREGGKRNSETRARLREAYATITGLNSDFTLQLGRQRFEDERAWWFHEDLDAVRLLYESGRLGLELSAARNEAIGGDFLDRERDARITSYLAVGHYDLDDDTQFSAYLSLQDHAERNEEPFFIGARSMGAIGSRFDYWIDAALVRGRDDGRDIRAHGFDVGAEYHLPLALEPSLQFGVAFGSGDGNPHDLTTNEFRQTGLQGSHFYYGEVLAPELSNMWIYTAGIELHPANSTSVRILYHEYRQHRAADRLRDVLIDVDPEGDSRDLGQALDIVASYEGRKDFYVDFILGMFLAGDAFGGETDRAYFAQCLFTYEF